MVLPPALSHHEYSFFLIQVEVVVDTTTMATTATIAMDVEH